MTLRRRIVSVAASIVACAVGLSCGGGVGRHLLPHGPGPHLPGSVGEDGTWTPGGGVREVLSPPTEGNSLDVTVEYVRQVCLARAHALEENSDGARATANYLFGSGICLGGVGALATFAAAGLPSVKTAMYPDAVQRQQAWSFDAWQYGLLLGGASASGAGTALTALGVYLAPDAEDLAQDRQAAELALWEEHALATAHAVWMECQRATEDTAAAIKAAIADLQEALAALDDLPAPMMDDAGVPDDGGAAAPDRERMAAIDAAQQAAAALAQRITEHMDQAQRDSDRWGARRSRVLARANALDDDTDAIRKELDRLERRLRRPCQGARRELEKTLETAVANCAALPHAQLGFRGINGEKARSVSPTSPAAPAAGTEGNDE